MQQSGRAHSMSSAGQSDRPPLRADAERNRARILEAARSIFAERGLDVPIEEIARRAGVGNATLYRRFPTRDALISASFEHKLAEYAKAAEEALRAPEAWTGFCTLVEHICAMQAADQGVKDVLTMSFPGGAGLEEQSRKAAQDVAELIRRAQAEGKLRPDVVPEDLGLLLMANAGVVQGMRDAAPEAWKRFVAFMIDAFRADRAGPLPEPPTPSQMEEARQRLVSTRSQER